jgi:pyridoxine kinase
MGDDGMFYVPEESVNVYRDELLAEADIITPNSFEAELLTGMKITTKEDAIAACGILHSKGVRNVIITGLSTSDDLILLLGSFVNSADPSKKDVFSIRIPKLSSKFTGAGDIFSALLLGWMARNPEDMKTAVELAVSTTYLVLKKTHDCGGGELRVIESKKIIEEPAVLFPATRECS